MKNPFNTFFDYLSERHTPGIRFLHIATLLLVITQIILSNFMHLNRSGEIDGTKIQDIATWSHISIGLVMLLIAVIFILLELGSHGFKHFFPYLFGDFSQIRKNLLILKSLHLPEPNSYGLATVVQGLGLGALALVVVSGSTWFYGWWSHADWAHDVLEIHETLTGLIEAYIIGHGGLGLLHIFFPSRRESAS